MILLPELETVSFDTTLPLCFRTESDDGNHQVAQLETRLALAVLAAPSDQDSEASPLQLRLEAKLDFMLELGLQARYPALPAARTCRIGLEAIAWCDSQPLLPATRGLLQLHPHTPSAAALHLSVQILDSRASDDGQYLLHARLLPFARETDTHRWERWVFHQHRLRIGQTQA